MVHMRHTGSNRSVIRILHLAENMALGLLLAVEVTIVLCVAIEMSIEVCVAVEVMYYTVCSCTVFNIFS